MARTLAFKPELRPIRAGGGDFQDDVVVAIEDGNQSGHGGIRVQGAGPLNRFCGRAARRALWSQRPAIGTVDEAMKLRHAGPMLVKAILSLHRAVLLAALTLALVATGFAHRMPGAQDGALALALANGVSLEDFCGDGPDGKARGGAPCLACQISGSADLPPAQDTLIRLELAFAAATIAPRESRAVARTLDPANAPQGPPAA
jgi:hypothetical protein